MSVNRHGFDPVQLSHPWPTPYGLGAVSPTLKALAMRTAIERRCVVQIWEDPADGHQMLTWRYGVRMIGIVYPL